jgi:uncharacterized membrane protein
MAKAVSVRDVKNEVEKGAKGPYGPYLIGVIVIILVLVLSLVLFLLYRRRIRMKRSFEKGKRAVGRP